MRGQLAMPTLLRQRHSSWSITFARSRQSRSARPFIEEAERVQPVATEGGWYAVLRVPAIRSDEEFASNF